MRVLHPALGEGLRVGGLRVHQSAEDFLPRVVRGLVGHLDLLRAVALLNAGDTVEAVGARRVVVRVGAVVGFPRGLEGGPVDVGAVVPLGLRVDVVLHDHRVLAHELHVGQEVRVHLNRGAIDLVGHEQAGLVPAPQLGHVAGVAVGRQVVPVRADFDDGQGQRAAVLDVVTALVVVVTLGDLRHGQVAGVRRIDAGRRFGGARGIAGTVAIARAAAGKQHGKRRSGRGERGQLTCLVHCYFLLYMVPTVMRNGMQPDGRSVGKCHTAAAPGVRRGSGPVVRRSAWA